MPTVRIVRQPSGTLNGAPWPQAGDTLELPDVVAETMAAAGDVEVIEVEAPKTEKRPARSAQVETRGRKG